MVCSINIQILQNLYLSPIVSYVNRFDYMKCMTDLKDPSHPTPI